MLLCNRILPRNIFRATANSSCSSVPPTGPLPGRIPSFNLAVLGRAGLYKGHTTGGSIEKLSPFQAGTETRRHLRLGFLRRPSSASELSPSDWSCRSSSSSSMPKESSSRCVGGWSCVAKHELIFPVALLASICTMPVAHARKMPCCEPVAWESRCPWLSMYLDGLSAINLHIHLIDCRRPKAGRRVWLTDAFFTVILIWASLSMWRTCKGRTQFLCRSLGRTFDGPPAKPRLRNGQHQQRLRREVCVSSQCFRE